MRTWVSIIFEKGMEENWENGGGERENSRPGGIFFFFSLWSVGDIASGGFDLWALGGCGKSIRTPKGRRRGRNRKDASFFPISRTEKSHSMKTETKYRKINICGGKKEHIWSKTQLTLFRPKMTAFWAPCSPDFCCSGPHKPTHAIETSRKRRKGKRRRKEGMGMVVQAHWGPRPYLSPLLTLKKNLASLVCTRAPFHTSKKKKRFRIQMCSNVEGKRSSLAIPWAFWAVLV